jgi:Na+/H+ antiporter NhaC
MSIGSSWTTAGTIGVGLTGVAAAIGVSPAITAGAVVSGAYLGDKLSPLSETTVLTAQLVGVRVDDHIKRQAWTSVPAFVIAFVVLLVLGLVKGPQVHAPVPTDIWLIIGAVTFGVLLEHFGLISRLINPLIATAKSTGRLFVTVFAVAFGLNVVAGDQYIALVLPAKMFRAEFARRGLAPTNLSRLAADSGTVTSPLVPWNSCGAFMARSWACQRSGTCRSRCSATRARC